MDAKFIIRLSENALCGLLMSAVESYADKNLNLARPRNMLETYGNLYGHENTLDNGDRVFHVELANTSTTAQQAHDSVSYSFAAISLKKELSQAFFPHLSLLGDFHSHPYLHYRRAEKNKCFYFSGIDRKNLTENSEYFRAMNFRIGMLVTIAATKRLRTDSVNYADSQQNCLRMDFGHYKIWITGYVIYIDETGNLTYSQDNAPEVLLHIPCLSGIYQMAALSRLKISGNRMLSCLATAI